MINLKILLSNDEEYLVKNFQSSTVMEFVRRGLHPEGPKKWYEVIPGTFIQIEHIVSITVMSEKEVAAIPKAEKIEEIEDAEVVILPQDVENEEIAEPVAA